MSEVSSALSAVDPDRLILKAFENGGCTSADFIAKKIDVLPTNEQDPVGCATFVIMGEDHTLGNLLRHTIMLNKDVEFCGYSIPHPSEDKMHIRIQSGTQGVSAISILDKALEDVAEMAQYTIDAFLKDASTGTYESVPDDY